MVGRRWFIIKLLVVLETPAVFSFVLYAPPPPIVLAAGPKRRSLHKATLDDKPGDADRVQSLFAWISPACQGDERYSELELAMLAIFGNPPATAEPARMKQEALAHLPVKEDTPCGSFVPLHDRELASLGPLAAGQWSGQSYAATFPHSILVKRTAT